MTKPSYFFVQRVGKNCEYLRRKPLQSALQEDAVGIFQKTRGMDRLVQVVLRDEKCFSIFGPDGFQHVNTIEQEIWGAISCKDPVRLKFFYVGNKLRRLNFLLAYTLSVFHRDDGVIHTARVFKT